MLVLETVAKIRRAYFGQRKTIKAICRELRVSRKVVRKVLRSDAIEFRYERGERPLPQIGPWQDALDGMLASNEIKPIRERLTLIWCSRHCVVSVTKAATMLCDAMPGVAARPGGDNRWARSFRSVSPRARRISSTGAMRSC
jgi:hypothetical protein